MIKSIDKETVVEAHSKDVDVISKPSVVEQAMQTLKDAMINEPDFAHSWHCNIAMACYDEIGENISHENAHKIGNKAASRFMKLCFGVETSN